MNPAVAQMLAQKLGVGDTYAALQSGNFQNMAGVVDDPMTMALLNSLNQAQNESEVDENQTDLGDELRRLKGVALRLKRRLEYSEAVILYISEATGACPICLGLDLRCKQCSGRGRPGYQSFNQEQLLLWLGSILGSLRRSSSGNTPNNA